MKNDNQQTIADAIKQMFHNYRLEDKVAEVRIRNMWPDVMGPAIRQHTGEIYFNKGVVTVFIQSAPLRQDLHFSREQIMQRINDELGERLVKEVIIR